MKKLLQTWGIYGAIAVLIGIQACKTSTVQPRTIANFCSDWKFNLGDTANAQDTAFDDSKWRTLNLPHDWSVEGEFSEKAPSGNGGGALPGGIGWYRKTFTIAATDTNKLVFIDFDGVYKNGEVWINDKYLGIRPYGYSSFRYNITPYVKFGNVKNVVAVKVDNSKQPNSRWYSGSGIYRNVWLVTTSKVFVDHWGTYVTTPNVSEKEGKVLIKTKIRNQNAAGKAITLNTIIYNAEGKEVAKVSTDGTVPKDSVIELTQETTVTSPTLWSLENPYLYRLKTEVITDGNVSDAYETPFGIRYFEFSVNKGFSLNGKHVKINGVCDHHDLGCLGAAVNKRGLERQLEILKEMGCNGIRTSHNPPAPELLDLCDKMGFLVLDEAFDMWKIQKTQFDYHLDWKAWHKRDLTDLIVRDRNHPSIVMWSIGNEVIEQWNPKDGGDTIARELAAIVKSLDSTRPVTAACNNFKIDNPLFTSGALDLNGFNYAQKGYVNFPKEFPGKKFLATETVSGLATRGEYDMPSDSVRRWPISWDKVFTTGNADFTCSAYDNCSAYWGSTQEETWKIMKKYDFLSGQFIWTGFDYIGEPTPYPWPAKSSYFGIIDLAGFPKDVYYMYQSEWTNKTVLHLFPHWNWEKGKKVDVLAYYNNADEVELFLNGKSQGIKKKAGDDLHVSWRVTYEPGTLKAVSRRNGKEIMTKEIKTAGKPAKLILTADRNTIAADASDLSFVTVKVVDAEGNIVPKADNLVKFELMGGAKIVGVDNGNPISHEPFKANYRKAFNGLCLAVVQSDVKAGKVTLTATSDGLEKASVEIEMK